HRGVTKTSGDHTDRRDGPVEVPAPAGPFRLKVVLGLGIANGQNQRWAVGVGSGVRDLPPKAHSHQSVRKGPLGSTHNLAQACHDSARSCCCRMCSTSETASRRGGSGPPYPGKPRVYLTIAVNSLKLDTPSAATIPARTVT